MSVVEIEEIDIANTDHETSARDSSEINKIDVLSTAAKEEMQSQVKNEMSMISDNEESSRRKDSVMQQKCFTVNSVVVLAKNAAAQNKNVQKPDDGNHKDDEGDSDEDDDSDIIELSDSSEQINTHSNNVENQDNGEVGDVAKSQQIIEESSKTKSPEDFPDLNVDQNPSNQKENDGPLEQNESRGGDDNESLNVNKSEELLNGVDSQKFTEESKYEEEKKESSKLIDCQVKLSGMPRRRSNLGRRTRAASAMRRLIASRSEAEKAAANERDRKRMTRIRHKQRLRRNSANQVQCVNLHCQSGYGLTEAPVFVLTYYGVPRRRNVLQRVCLNCFHLAFKHQEKLAFRLKYRIPLLKADFPSRKEDVVVMDPEEEIYEEKALPQNVISQVEKNLMSVMQETLKKYDFDFQLDQAHHILSDKYRKLEAKNKIINQDLELMETYLTKSRRSIYKEFTPKIKEIPPLDIVNPSDCLSPLQVLSLLKSKPAPPKKGRSVGPTETPKTHSQDKNMTSHDIVSVEEVEIPHINLPPLGVLTYPPLSVGDQVYIMKTSFFGVWLKGKVVEVLVRGSEGDPTYRVRYESYSRNQNGTKIVGGKHLAYSKPSPVRYPVGTRVVALFKNIDAPAKETYYAGVIAEPPKHINKYRYLVFFDDGYSQYVLHEKIHLVCECSRFVHEDIHPESRDFIKNYLDQYPERPMVKLQQGQTVRTERNGKWSFARVLEIDCSLAKMHFTGDNRSEWIYRGSTRLGPLFSEFVAAAARKEQGGLSRHRSLGIASLKKRNMPYVEYLVDQDDMKSGNSTAGVSKNVAKKSTTSKTSQENLADKNVGPPTPFEKMENISKGYIRSIDVSTRIPGRKFAPHQCGPPCVEWTNFAEADRKGINPLALPLFFGFERQLVKMKGKRGVMYRAPCGRRLRSMVEVHRYLRITKTLMGLDLFDFDQSVHVLDEFHLEPDMYCTHVKDISYGRENTPVSCVNEICHSWPSFMEYSTCRIPQGGVNICLDEEFLVCCDCTDDCQDKEKCECWQLTIEGTKLGPEGVADPSVGYQNKRLLEPVTTGIYECNQRCKCASTCLNRVAQHPLQLNLQVFRTLKKGWGLRTLNDIPQGGFICIYAGRLHTEQSANDDGRMYGDEYLAELDYIEVVERFKEGYESEVTEPKESYEEENEECEHDEQEENVINKDDQDYVPLGFVRLSKTENTVNTRARKKRKCEEKSESENEKEKEDGEADEDLVVIDDDEDELKKKPSKFTAAVPVDEDRPRKYKSVREMFGDGADDCYIMDAKSDGNIGRYLNHSCQPNVFVQNVFVDTHDVRFPWVAFFALTHIKAGTELTWDYNYDVGSVPDKVLYCYCNNVECRGRLL